MVSDRKDAVLRVSRGPQCERNRGEEGEREHRSAHVQSALEEVYSPGALAEHITHCHAETAERQQGSEPFEHPECDRSDHRSVCAYCLKHLQLDFRAGAFFFSAQRFFIAAAMSLRAAGLMRRLLAPALAGAGTADLDLRAAQRAFIASDRRRLPAAVIPLRGWILRRQFRV
jgi:hypothetical protein